MGLAVGPAAPTATAVEHLCEDSGSAPDAPGAHHAARSTERAVSCLLAGVMAFVAAGPISDNSLLTHLATGRVQLGAGLPRNNLFLTTSSDFPVPSWWWSWMLGAADALLGLTGVRLLTAAVAAVLGWMVVRASRPVTAPSGPADSLVAQLLPPVVALALLGPFLNGRPQLAGFVLLAAALVVWRERLSPWWLAAVFAVWVNVHGTWLYGLAVLALTFLAEGLDRGGLRLGRWAWERWRWGVAALAGSVVGGLAYPQRMRLVLLPSEQLGSEEARRAMRIYQEWKPPGAGSALVWVLALVALLALYGTWCGRRPGSAVAVVALFAMGVSSYRLLPVAAITLAGFGAAGVQEIASSGLPGPLWRRTMVAVGALALLGAGIRCAVAPHEDLARFPVEEVDWLDERGLVAQPGVQVVSNDVAGNYLEYRFGPDARAWIDDRPSVGTLLEWVTLRDADPGWEAVLDRADPDVVLTRSEDRLAEVLAGRDGWVVGTEGDTWVVLCAPRVSTSCT